MFRICWRRKPVSYPAGVILHRGRIGGAMSERSSYRVVIVGAGFGGIGMALALQRAGIDDFLIVDGGDEIGGTWRDNTYPGAACDVPANLYSFSFWPGRPSRRFPGQPETLSYLQELSAEREIGA